MKRSSLFGKPHTRFFVLLLAVFLACASACDSVPEKPHELQEARKAYSDRDYLTAELRYKQYLQKNREAPDRWEAWDRLAEIACVRGNNREAVELLQSMAIEFSGDRERKKNALERLSAVYESERHWSRAIHTLTELLAIPQLSPEERAQFNLRLGRAYAVRHEYDMALAAFEACFGSGGDAETAGQCLLSMESLYLGMDRLEDAENTLARLRELPGVPENCVVLAVFNMADFMESKGRLKEALELFRGIMPRYPNPAAIAARVNSLEKQVEKP